MMLKDEVKDTLQTYQLKKNLTKVLFIGLISSLVLNAILGITIFSLFPLKENVPYLVRFSNASMNFAEVYPADESISQNEYLKKSLITAFILNAETKNNIDDKQRGETIRLQSNNLVWEKFKAIWEMPDSIFSNSNLVREINIVGINLFPNTNFAQVDFQATVKRKNEILKQSNFKVTLEYQFGAIKLKHNEIALNPTGFKMISYSVSKYKEER